ncbi:insulinase family protein [Clostridium sp. 19966]|uniref:M16 family metallopeptidase n=1 Tax=Clostridium sp. 19966 TaxID=2768166 RepID=UPI0028DE019F|nr:pitrilysin family protein [Clostridium sp. 19966]MDT8716695.1 insulinase family protein [Clostridium sp. 19966]
MECCFLDNGIKFIYMHRDTELSSFCIGYNAGALEEKDYELGTAHAVEHMLFKGTKKRDEQQINEEFDRLFAFNNAMTNYPYVIYYGTLRSRDFAAGFELYSDILLNADFKAKGFEEEMDVIRQELVDWEEDYNQVCEDELFYNSYKMRRIKEKIIGTKESIDKISLSSMEEYYNRYYCPGNCVVSVVSSLEFNECYNVVNKIFGSWGRPFKGIYPLQEEKNIPGIYSKGKGIQGAKIKYIFDIHNLNPKELCALHIFNMIFGEGVSSMLYDEVRTKKGMAYEVGSRIKNERGIKLFSIDVSTSKENLNQCLKSIDECIEKAKNMFFEDNRIADTKNRLLLKNLLTEERSVELCKKVTTYELMYGDFNVFKEEFNYNVTGEDIKNVINTVLQKPSIQLIL